MFAIASQIIPTTLLIAITMLQETLSNPINEIVMDTSTVEFVAVVTRHGSRSPVNSFSNDNYPYGNLKFWPYGKGELTALGRLETLETGRLLRMRYGSLLGPSYDKRDVLIAYNPFPRDNDSALCTLAGLYPTKKHKRWCARRGTESPLIVRDFDIALFFGNETSKCPTYFKETRRLLNELNESLMKTEENQNLLSYLSQHTGSKLTEAIEIYRIYDALTFQFHEGYFQPSWSFKVYPEPMRSITRQVMSAISGGSPLLVRLGAAPILEHLLSKMVAKVEGTQETNKMYIEVTHDVTVMSLINALQEGRAMIDVETGGFILFELHLIDGNYFIQVHFYHNSHSSYPIEVKIKSCPHPCSLETFTEFVTSIQPVDHEKECKEGVEGF